MINSYEWGGNNIPLSDTNTDNINYIETNQSLTLRILWDWISATTDVIDYNESYDPRIGYVVRTIAHNPKNDEILGNILRLVDANPNWREHEQTKCRIANFDYSIFIGEFIELNFSGPRSANDRPVTQLLLRGEACREFIEHRNGNWVKLFSYLKTINASFKRSDLAIDCFSKKIIDIYDLRIPAEKKHWVGSVQTLSVRQDIDFRGGIFSKGYSLTFGSPSSNQLQIYDKNLERKAANKETFKTDVWYRFEMRFIDDKADNVITHYLIAMQDQEHDPNALAKFAKGCLLSMVEFKKPSKNDSNVSRWKTLPAWQKFLTEVEKIDIKTHGKIERTIEQKKRWRNRSIASMDAMILCSDPENYVQEHLTQAGMKIAELSNVKKEAINKQRASLGLPLLKEKDFKELAEKYDNYGNQYLNELLVKENILQS